MAQMAATAGSVAVGSTIGHGLSNMLFGSSNSTPAAPEAPAAPVQQQQYQQRQRRSGVQQQQKRWQSTEGEAAAAASPKIAGIVDQISGLTLLETADLVKVLKVRPPLVLLFGDSFFLHSVVFVFS